MKQLLLLLIVLSLVVCSCSGDEETAEEGGGQQAAGVVATEAPTAEPTKKPTAVPTEEPTAVPTEEPTAVPTEEPTAVPTEEPTAVPTEEPTAVPTEEPTPVPLDEWEMAIEDYLTIVDNGNASPETLNNLCWFYGLTGQAEKALPFCEQAIEADPSSQYVDSRGLAHSLLGDQAAAITDYQLVVDDLVTSQDPFEREIRAERLVWLAVLVDGGNPFTPRVMARLRGEDPPSGTDEEGALPDELAALDQFMLGRQMHESNHFEEAIEAYSQAIELFPEFDEAYYFRAIAYRFIEEPALAIGDYNKAIELNANNAPAYHLRGLTHGTLGDLNQAIQDYSEAIAIDPEVAEYYSSRGIDLISLNQLDDALADLDQALSLERYNPWYLYIHGTILFIQGDMEGARTDLEFALELEPHPELATMIEGLLEGLP